MKASEIRKKFLGFFKSKQHKIIASDSLVPKDDPTVLFTTAGMQQFKRQFLGELDDFTRASTSQKCMRTDDLDEVGNTDFHHTFFEMLGNFSFGDYFKKEAIHWAWEFLTEELGIPARLLWVSVYVEDQEAEAVWKNEIGIPDHKIFRLGGKSNFWPSNAKEKGPNGPCGPCSEIFYDYQWEEKGDQNPPTDPDDERGRFSEVWNLVFTQFNRKDGGVLEPLPNKNIDTGMGLERLTAVMQGKKNNFETDLFEPIIAAVEKEFAAGTNVCTLKDKRIIADHIRAVTFGISDGVMPTNEGRGYVIRKLIVAMSEKAIAAGLLKPVIFKLVPSVVSVMSEQYPEIVEKKNLVMETIESVEKAYIKLRNEKLPEYKRAVKGILEYSSEKRGEELGKSMFLYRDTHGLSLEILQKEARQIGIDENCMSEADAVFQKFMAAQQEKSRAGSKMTGDVFAGEQLELNVPKTEFIGYQVFRSSSTVLRIFKNNAPVAEAHEGDEVKIVLEKTPFYAESGGQVGDTGVIVKDGCQIRIGDTQKISDVFLHVGIVEKGSLKTNDLVSAEIDAERRLAIMRNHTATHLLQAALREILGTHVQQQGSYVSAEQLRLDFSHPKAVTLQQIADVERRVNEWIMNCDGIAKEYLSIDEAKRSGALAFFADKYGETVRVISVGDYSKEFCGGTHLDSVGQIGIFKIVGESAIAQGIRRIEGKTGLGAFAVIKEQEQVLSDLAGFLKVPAAQLMERVKDQLDRVKEMEGIIARLKYEAVKDQVDALIVQAPVINTAKIVSCVFEELEIETLRQISDLIKQKTKTVISVLGSRTSGNASVMIAVSDDLVAKGIKANELILNAAQIIQGKGGGRPQMAQAGSRQPSQVDQAVEQTVGLIKEKMIE